MISASGVKNNYSILIFWSTEFNGEGSSLLV